MGNRKRKRVKRKFTLEEKKVVNKWLPTGLLDMLQKRSEELLRAARELDVHAQYALDHMAEYENWIDPDANITDRKPISWANWYFNKKIEEMRSNGRFEGNNQDE